MNKKVDENNGREGTQENGRFQNLRQISRNEFWNNIWCLLSAPTFGIGWSILWKKYPNISGKKRKRYLIRLKVDLYEVCASLFHIVYYCYYFYTNNYFTSTRFVASIILRKRSSGIIGQEDYIWRETRRKISSGGKCY